jgi:hypothetical protein
LKSSKLLDQGGVTGLKSADFSGGEDGFFHGFTQNKLVVKAAYAYLY